MGFTDIFMEKNLEKLKDVCVFERRRYLEKVGWSSMREEEGPLSLVTISLSSLITQLFLVNLREQ